MVFFAYRGKRDNVVRILNGMVDWHSVVIRPAFKVLFFPHSKNDTGVERTCQVKWEPILAADAQFACPAEYQ